MLFMPFMICYASAYAQTDDFTALHTVIILVKMCLSTDFSFKQLFKALNTIVRELFNTIPHLIPSIKRSAEECLAFAMRIFKKHTLESFPFQNSCIMLFASC